MKYMKNTIKGLNQQGFSPLVILVIFALLILTGSIGYVYLQQEKVPQPPQSKRETIAPQPSSVVGEPSIISSDIKPTFIAPVKGTQWKIGERYLIRMSHVAPYNDHCSNNLSLVTATGDIVGVIGLIHRGQGGLEWEVKSLLSHSCGTGASIVSVAPGIYKIRLTQNDPEGKEPLFIVNSDDFLIVQ